jgi:hypothetical protein
MEQHTTLADHLQSMKAYFDSYSEIFEEPPSRVAVGVSFGDPVEPCSIDILVCRSSTGELASRISKPMPLERDLRWDVAMLGRSRNACPEESGEERLTLAIARRRVGHSVQYPP